MIFTRLLNGLKKGFLAVWGWLGTWQSTMFLAGTLAGKALFAYIEGTGDAAAWFFAFVGWASAAFAEYRVGVLERVLKLEKK